MKSVPMLYVNVITGPSAGRRSFCYVCQYSDAPVIAVFIKPEALEKPGLLEAVQKLNDKHPELQPFVVCLSGPDDVLEDKLRDLAREKNLTIPLTVLPGKNSVESLYKLLSINKNAEVTILLYSGRYVKQKFEDLEFFGTTFPPTSSPPLGLDFMVAPNPTTEADLADTGELLDASPAFIELDEAASRMIAEA